MTAEEAAAAFDGHKGYLTAVAYRSLGTLADAEDAVQETYLRFARADLDAIREPRGWLTTVIRPDLPRPPELGPGAPRGVRRALAA